MVRWMMAVQECVRLVEGKHLLSAIVRSSVEVSPIVI